MRGLWAIALLGLASPAMAEPRAVLGGEHPGFTRLVVDLRGAGVWSVVPGDGSARVTVEGGEGVDLSRAFDRIGRSRVAALTGDAGGFDLALACDCPVAARRDASGWLVIDVADGAAGLPPTGTGSPDPGEGDGSRGGTTGAGSPAPRLADAAVASGLAGTLAPDPDHLTPQAAVPTDAGARIGPTQAVAAGGEAWAPDRPGAALRVSAGHGQPEIDPLPASGPPSGGEDQGVAPFDLAGVAASPDASATAAQAILGQTPTPARPAAIPPVPGGPVLDPAGHLRVSAAERSLAAGLAAAAGAGLLDPDASLAPTEEDGVVLPLARTDALAPGVTVHDPAEQAGTPAATDGSACLPDAAFDLAAWSVDPADLPARVAALGDARDRIDPAAVEDLARAWIALGFGREAGAVLTLDDARSVERDRLALLAALIDGRPADPAPLAGQAGCPGAVALWLALATGDLGPEPSRAAALAAYRVMPSTAQAVPGLSLARLFLDAGEPGRAAEVIALARAAAPSATGMPGEPELRAAILAAGGDAAGAEATLRAAEARDPRLAPEAVATLLDRDAARGVASVDRLALAEALRAEYHADAAATGALLAAEVRALSAAHDHAGALARLSQAAEGPARADMVAGAAAALVAEPDAAAFLTAALGDLPPDLAPADANALAARVLQLGFAPESLALLAPDADGAAMAERRRLRAAAHLALGEPEAALVALSGANGDPAAWAMRAEIETRLGIAAPRPRSPAPRPDGPRRDAAAALLASAGAERTAAEALLAAPLPADPAPDG